MFGDKCSPCEANNAVIRNTKDNKEEWPVAAAVVQRDIFVDDLLTKSGNDDDSRCASECWPGIVDIVETEEIVQEAKKTITLVNNVEATFGLVNVI